MLIAGLALAASAVRMLLVVPVGVIVDRVDRRLLTWLPNVLRGLTLATGIEPSVIGDSQREEALMATIPLAMLGSLLGGLGYGLLSYDALGVLAGGSAMSAIGVRDVVP